MLTILDMVELVGYVVKADKLTNVAPKQFDRSGYCFPFNLKDKEFDIHVIIFFIYHFSIIIRINLMWFVMFLCYYMGQILKIFFLEMQQLTWTMGTDVSRF